MTELATIYDPKEIEPDVYSMWARAGAFDAEATGRENSFCMVIPPPNVTAALHLGHALNNTLQDILIRWRRMEQRNTLWMPGTDHAGIATQTVVEKRILAEENKRRTDFKREDFVARIQAWKDEYEERIIEQLQRMGCSCDWRRTRFTMDETCAKAVRETFFRLFSQGLIYRGKRLVNWDPQTQTVLADDEVDHQTVQGSFYYLKYPLVKPVQGEHGEITHVTVATTRPETMLGDTAVAMNPRDERARLLAGKKVLLPIVGREIPIITDEHVVPSDPDSDDDKAKFSTGFLKVTPAHDPNDWEIGTRHDLPVINVMAPDGSISDKHGWTDAGSDAQFLLGMDRFEAREAIVEWFRTEGLLEDVKPYAHEVGHSYRSHVPIEPYLSDQWYIAVKRPIDQPSPADEWMQRHPDMIEFSGKQAILKETDIPVNSLAGLALQPVLDGRLKFTPDRYARNYRSWLENLRDWPISRQLWWGHQIPVWSRQIDCPDGDRHSALNNAIGGDFTKTLDALPGRYSIVLNDHPQLEGVLQAFICVDTDDSPIVATIEKAGWQRDCDVLDTWFSSALWPFSTLGWPDRTPMLDTFYPGDVLCTAREIITLWVSRMVMMGQYCVGDIPFSDVFIHAMIQDGEGRKMSKSLGNGIDPLDIIDSHGADAMRYTLAAMTTQTQDVRMPVERMTLPDGREVNSSPKFDIGRNFCNKLWNASRFAMMNLTSMPSWNDIRPTAHLCDRWILSRLNAAVRDATLALEGFRFNELADKLYHFIWDDFCDWYLEAAKVRINAGDDTPKALVAHCLDMVLRLMHPIAPFITEAIWANLNSLAPCRGPGDDEAEPLLARANWPQADASANDPRAVDDFTLLQDLIRQIRNVRMQHNVPPSRKVPAQASVTGDERVRNLLSDNLQLVMAMAGLDNVEITDAPTAGEDAAAVSAGPIKLYVQGIVDKVAEIDRLTKQHKTLCKGITSIENKLRNEAFIAKAPPAVVQKERQRLTELHASLQAVEQALEAMK